MANPYSSSVFLSRELLILRLHHSGRDVAGQDQQAIPEGRRLSRLQREFQFLLAVAEDLLAERVGRKQAVAARVPVSRIAGILRMIEHHERNLFFADLACEGDPSPASWSSRLTSPLRLLMPAARRPSFPGWITRA